MYVGVGERRGVNEAKVSTLEGPEFPPSKPQPMCVCFRRATQAHAFVPGSRGQPLVRGPIMTIAHHPRILMVEDSPVTLKFQKGIVERALRRHGIDSVKIDVARDGLEAVSHVTRLSDVGESYLLITMDLAMPFLDGVQVGPVKPPPPGMLWLSRMLCVAPRPRRMSGFMPTGVRPLLSLL